MDSIRVKETMKLIFQFKHIDGKIIPSGGGFAVSKFHVNIRFVNGDYVFWRDPIEYGRITKKL